MIANKIIINVVRNTYNNLRVKLDSRPRLRSLIYYTYDKITLLQLKLKLNVYKRFPNRDNIIYINPEKIIYEKDLNQNNWRLLLKFIKPLFNPRLNDTIQIINGNWDLKENLSLFNDDIKHVSYFKHFIEGIDWRETPYYNREAERYLKGNIRKEYKNSKDLDLKFIYHDRLYEKIKSEGFKSQREIMQSEGYFINYGRGQITRKVDDDITVGIGRDGNIIFFDGRHRLNVAKILHLKKIPVRILVIHPDFISKLKIKP